MRNKLISAPMRRDRSKRWKEYQWNLRMTAGKAVASLLSGGLRCTCTVESVICREPSTGGFVLKISVTHDVPIRGCRKTISAHAIERINPRYSLKRFNGLIEEIVELVLREYREYMSDAA